MQHDNPLNRRERESVSQLPARLAKAAAANYTPYGNKHKESLDKIGTLGATYVISSGALARRASASSERYGAKLLCPIGELPCRLVPSPRRRNAGTHPQLSCRVTRGCQSIPSFQRVPA